MNCRDCSRNFQRHEMRNDLCFDCTVHRLEQAEQQVMNLLTDQAAPATTLSDNAVDDSRRALWRTWPYLHRDLPDWKQVPPEPVVAAINAWRFHGKQPTGPVTVPPV